MKSHKHFELFYKYNQSNKSILDSNLNYSYIVIHFFLVQIKHLKIIKLINL